MATILNKYLQVRDSMQEKIKQGALPCDQILVYQEILYRISVLETCQAFCKTAPVTMDAKQLSYHYKIVDAYLTSLISDHKFGMPADEALKAKRKTASASLQEIIQSCRKSFSSFKPVTNDLYRTNISALVNTVLPVWVQYRDAYIQL